MRRTIAALLMSASLLLASVSGADADARAFKADDVAIRRAIVKCLFYVSVKDPQVFDDLIKRRRTGESFQSKIEFEFNSCVFRQNVLPMLWW